MYLKTEKIIVGLVTIVRRYSCLSYFSFKIVYSDRSSLKESKLHFRKGFLRSFCYMSERERENISTDCASQSKTSPYLRLFLYEPEYSSIYWDYGLGPTEVLGPILMAWFPQILIEFTANCFHYTILVFMLNMMILYMTHISGRVDSVK